MMPLLLALALVQAAAPQETETDLVFVVDSSNSVARSDPQDFRRRALRAAADLMAERGRVRVSLLPFAGWNESAGREPAPLLRENDLARLAKAVQDLPSYGYATDVNVAFELGLPRILEARQKAGASGPLWFVFVSDGQFDVVEEKIRPEYEEVAKRDFAKQYGQEKDVALLNAALRRFEQTVKAKLAGLKVSAHGIHLGKAALAPDSPYQRVLAAFGGTPRIHPRKDQPLKDVFWPLAAENPGFRAGREAFSGYESQEQAAWSVPLRVFPGTERVAVLAWSESPDYDVSIAGLAGVKTTGSGASHRVLTALKPAPGVYVVSVNSKGGKRVEIVSTVDAALRLQAKVAGDAVVGTGDPIRVEVSVVDGSGKPVESPELAKLARVEAVVRPPQGAPVALPLEASAKGTWTATATTAASGTYALEFKGFVRLPGGRDGADLVLEPVAATATAAVRWEASFDRAEAWLGQEARVRLKPLKGAPEGTAAIPLALKGPGAPTLRLERGGDVWTASFKPAAAGEWTLPSGILDGRHVSAGKPAALAVKPRTLRVTKDGAPVSKLEIDAKYDEPGRYPLGLKVDVDADASEKVAVAASYDGDALAKLEWPEAFALGEKSPEMRTGTLRIAAKVAGQDLGSDLPVEFRFPDYAKKMFVRRLPYLAGALLLIALGVLYAMLQKFSTHQVRIVRDDGSLGAEVLLKDWARGLTRREAVGTPEVQESLRFRMRGLKPKPPACTLEPAKEGVSLARNGESAATGGPLSHGDELAVRADGEPRLYYYFEKPPTPDEIARIQNAVCERDLIFLEEDDRL
jgi:Mg-chelatase subunit ChlD